MSLAFSWINLILSFLRLVDASWTLALLFSRSFAMVLWTTYTNIISSVGVEWLNSPCWSTGGELRISCLLFHNTPQHEHDDHWSACLWRCRLSLCSESQPGKYFIMIIRKYFSLYLWWCTVGKLYITQVSLSPGDVLSSCNQVIPSYHRDAVPAYSLIDNIFLQINVSSTFLQV